MLRLLPVLGIMLAAGAAIAQSEPATLWNYSVVGEYDGSAVNLEISLDVRFASDPSSVLGEVTGLDVYRIPLELNRFHCPAETRITHLPLPWTTATTTPLSFRDDNVEPDRWYAYLVRPVNEARETVPVVFGWAFPLDGLVRTGNVPIAHGTLEWALPWAFSYLWGCDGECGWNGEVSVSNSFTLPPSATGTYWFFGDIGFHDPQNGWRLMVTGAQPAPSCLVPVTPTTWTSVKSLYR
jgi:hypothetical protein